MVTLIADNYYGYCKKEVKTQISFAANLFGSCEEEHAGGALAFATYVLGQDFFADRTVSLKAATFADVTNLLGELIAPQADGHAVDRRFRTSTMCLRTLPSTRGKDSSGGGTATRTPRLALRAEDVYVLPSGYRVRLQKQVAGTAWRLVGSRPRGTLCHKPCTVSGGGKSEISKSIADAVLKGSVFVKDYHGDMEAGGGGSGEGFFGIYRQRPSDERSRRPILSPARSLGSVIQLLTPSADYTDRHNAWARQLSQTVRQLVFTLKRYYQPDWGDNWREHFTVDRINGFLGHELKFDNQKLVCNYLRVGYDPEGAWRIYKLRPDFSPAEKVQMEDDITASIVLPRRASTTLTPNTTTRASNWWRTASASCSSGPTTPSNGEWTRRRRPTSPARETFSPISSRSRSTRRGALVEHVVEFDHTPSR